ncbi:Hypothetical predicted protein, partial [Marmota monax]
EIVTMSGALNVLQMKEEDVLKFLAAGTHFGGTNLDFQVEQCIYKSKSDGLYITDLKRRWAKLLLAARAIENSADVRVISSRNTGQRAVRSCCCPRATPIASCFIPGTFTNQIQAAFPEPHLLVVPDPRVTTSHLRKHLMSTCLPLLCVTQNLLCTMWTLPFHATTRELILWV